MTDDLEIMNMRKEYLKSIPDGSFKVYFGSTLGTRLIHGKVATPDNLKRLITEVYSYAHCFALTEEKGIDFSHFGEVRKLHEIADSKHKRFEFEVDYGPTLNKKHTWSPEFLCVLTDGIETKGF